MTAVVVRSLNDAAGDRCVDILRLASEDFAYVECRRDPEDSYGWRHLAPPVGGFADVRGAEGAARASIGWLEVGS